jgi:hypothetical protein
VYGYLRCYALHFGSILIFLRSRLSFHTASASRVLHSEDVNHMLPRNVGLLPIYSALPPRVQIEGKRTLTDTTVTTSGFTLLAIAGFSPAGGTNVRGHISGLAFALRMRSIAGSNGASVAAAVQEKWSVKL